MASDHDVAFPTLSDKDLTALAARGQAREVHTGASQHPIMRSFERGEDWSWCYVDEVFFEPAVTPRI